MDNYFKGPNPEERKNLEKYNFDCPYALDLDLLYQHLLCLLDNKEINMPVYEFRGSYRKNETIKVYPKRIILIEGILAFHDDRIRGLMDLKIFVNLGGDLRLTRRIERDIADRGRELMTIIERYLKFVKPAYETYIYPTKKYADLVIPKGAENSLGIDFVFPESFGTKITVNDAIGDLPDLVNGQQEDIMSYKLPSGKASDYARLMRDGSRRSRQNYVSKNADYVIERYRFIGQGQNWQAIPDELMQNYANKSNCHSGIYRRLDAEEPSVVISNYRKNMLIHPFQDRGLSVREAARRRRGRPAAGP